MAEIVIVYTDKTMLKITGIRVKGLRAPELEERLQQIFHRPVRLIGVTGNQIEMDIYDLDNEAALNKADGVVQAISFVEGITADNIIEISCSGRSVELNVEEIRRLAASSGQCGRESWIKMREE